MIRVNNVKVKVFELDSLETVLNRIVVKVFDGATLPQYLIFDPPLVIPIADNKSVQAIDLLADIKSAIEEQSVWDYIRDNNGRLQHGLTTEDVAKLWILNLPDSSTRSYIEIIGNELVKRGYVESVTDILLYWTNRASERASLKARIAVQKVLVQQQDKMFKRLDEIEIEEPEKLNITDETIDFIIDTEDITMLELFNEIQCNNRFPFASVNGIYKILKEFVPPVDWVSVPDKIMIKFYERDNMLINYNDKFFNDITITYQNNQPVISTSLKSKKKYLDRQEFFQQLSNIFISNLPIQQIVEKEVVSIFYIPNILINMYIFADLVMNNLMFASMFVINERDKATKKRKQNSIENWVYFRFNSENTGLITATMSQRVVDYKNSEQIDFDRSIYKHGDTFLRIRAKAANVNKLKLFQIIFTKMIKIYQEEEEKIFNFYQSYIPDFSTFIPTANEVDLREPSIVDPKVFVKKYSRSVCEKPRMPTIIYPDEIEQYEDDGQIIMKYPRDKLATGIVYPSDGVNQNYYICTNPTHPYPGVRLNNLGNADEYPYVPCCFNKPQDIENSIYRHYFNNDPYIERSSFQQDLIVTDKILAYKKFGTLPEAIQTILRTIDDNTDYEYIRIGLPQDSNSFVYATIMGNKKYLGPDMVTVGQLDIHKLAQSTQIPVAKQCGHNYSVEQLSNILTSDTYTAPDIFVQLLEEYYRCNIYILTKDGLKLPQYENGYFRYTNKFKRNVFIFEHYGSEFDNSPYPQCELIVRWPTNKPQVTYNFGYDDILTTSMRKIFYQMTSTFLLNRPIIDIPPLKFLDYVYAQELDPSSKTRRLDISYDNNLFTMITSPLPPLPVAVMEDPDGVNYATSKQALALFEHIGVEVVGQVVNGTKMVELLGRLNMIDVRIPISDSKRAKNIAVISDEISYIYNKTVSKLDQYNYNSRIARYLMEYTFWLFSRYIDEKNIVMVDENILNQFSKDMIKVDSKFEYGIVTKTFTTRSGLMKNGKLIATSVEMVKRLLYTLKLFSMRYRVQLLQYKNKRVMENYFKDVGDFTPYEHQVILTGQDVLQKWSNEKNRNIRLYDTVQLEKRDPYFFRHQKIRNNSIFIAVNTITLDQALEIGYQWDINGFNDIRVSQKRVFDETGFYLYHLETPLDVKYYAVGPMPMNINIMTVKKNGVTYYTVLLDLK